MRGDRGIAPAFAPAFAMALVAVSAVLPSPASAGVSPRGPVFPIAPDGSAPDLAHNLRGETALAWSDGAAVLVQRRSAAGALLAEDLAIEPGDFLRAVAPSVGLDAAGGLVVAWLQVLDTGGVPPLAEIFVQRFDRTGEPRSAAFAAFDGAQLDHPAVLVAADGSFAVLGTSGGGPEAPAGVFLRRYDASGSPLGPPRQVLEEGERLRTVAGAGGAVGPEGELLVVWESFGCATDNCFDFRLRGRLFDGAGEALGDSFEITDAGTGFAVEGHPSGRFLVVWHRPVPNDFVFLLPVSFGVRGRTVSRDGLGEEIVLKAPADGLLQFLGPPPALAVDALGNALVLWQDAIELERPSEVFGQLLGPDLQPSGERFPLPREEGVESFEPALAAEGAGAFLAAWAAASGPDFPREIRGQRWQLSDGPCLPSERRLCLAGRRFELTGTFQVPGGPVRPVRFVTLSDDSAFGWLGRPDNPEMLVKLLDGRGINGFRWFFFGGLTHLSLELVLRDTLTQESRTYSLPAGRATSFADLRSLPATGGGLDLFSALPGLPPVAPTSPPVTSPAGSCLPSTTVLCFGDGRFAAVVWRIVIGGSDVVFDPGHGVPLTPDGGAFFFARRSNLELILKMVDGRAVNGHFWIFHGAATNQVYRIVVTDTETGRMWFYDNPRGELASGFDTRAFPGE